MDDNNFKNMFRLAQIVHIFPKIYIVLTEIVNHDHEQPRAQLVTLKYTRTDTFTHSEIQSWETFTLCCLFVKKSMIHVIINQLRQAALL